MAQFRFAVLGIAVAFLIGCARCHPQADDGEAESLEGSWEVTSVQRDGEPELLEAGALLTFTGNEVKFQPKTPQFTDWAS